MSGDLGVKRLDEADELERIVSTHMRSGVSPHDGCVWFNGHDLVNYLSKNVVAYTHAGQPQEASAFRDLRDRLQYIITNHHGVRLDGQA